MVWWWSYSGQAGTGGGQRWSSDGPMMAWWWSVGSPTMIRGWLGAGIVMVQQ
jgi:hypothetical protein